MRCLLICILILVCGFLASHISALKCITPDGLQVDEVRKVIKKCMKKVTTDGATADELAKSYDEYESYEESPHGAKDRGRVEDASRRRGANDRMNNNYNDEEHSSVRAGGNYHRRNDRHDPSPYNPYQPQQQSPYGGDNNNNFSSQRGGNFHYSNGGQNNNENNSTAEADKHERDRSCILQCFFQELKMANEEGFPDRNRMISVLTKRLRDRELRDFYVDSVQECSRMVGMDEARVQRDNCLYSRSLIVCLSERAKMNCVDWNAETVIF